MHCGSHLNRIPARGHSCPQQRPNARQAAMWTAGAVVLWVYSPNHGQNTAKYYAGDQYVDLVGLDAYTDFIDKQHIKGYDEVAALPKPFGFTEFGPHGSQNPPGDYDYRRLLEGIRKDFPKTCFFKSWNGKWSLASNLNTKELLADPAIANREDLPPELFKK